MARRLHFSLPSAQGALVPGKPSTTELLPQTPKLDDLITRDRCLRHSSTWPTVQNEVPQDM